MQNKAPLGISKVHFMKVAGFLFILFGLFLLFSFQGTKAQEDPPEPPEIPLPGSCFSSPPTVGHIFVDHWEEDPPMPQPVARHALPGPTPSNTVVTNIPHFNEESYNTNFEFNVKKFFCQTSQPGFFNPNWSACSSGQSTGDWSGVNLGSGYIQGLWSGLIAGSGDDPNDFEYADEQEFKDQYIDPDGFVGNYGVQNMLWLDDWESDNFFDSSMFRHCWPSINHLGDPIQVCNSNLLSTPNPNHPNFIECQEDLLACYGPYFSPDKVDEDGNLVYPDDPVCEKAPPPPSGGPGTSAWEEWNEEYGDWMDLDPYSDFGSGTIIPPFDSGSQWSPNFGTPLGGRATSAFPCLCSGTWAVNVSGPDGINFGTYTYAWLGQFANWRLPWPRHWVIGLTSKQQSCVQWSGTSCSLQKNSGTFSPIVGTSPF